MKGLLLLALFVGSVNAAATVAMASQICQVPTKYTIENGNACAGAETGYVITGYCQNPFHPSPTDIQLAPTVSAQLLPGTASAWSTTVVALANAPGCTVPAHLDAWTNVNFGASFQTDANQCGASAQVPAATAQAAATATTFKGVSITCATGFYAAAGVEGSMFCLGGAGAGTIWTNMNAATSQGIWSATVGLMPNTLYTASWGTSVLTCNLGCTFSALFCTANTWHANIIIWGSGLVANTCTIRPGTTATLYCRSDPFTPYTATCTAAGTANTAGVLTFGTTPNCGGTDGALTGYYINDQASGIANQLAGQISQFGSASSTLSKSVSAVLGQWGGYPRVTEPFQTASTYIVIITGCPTDATNGECVQRVINWWRCAGLTIDASAVCFGNTITRYACPTHTLGFRCPSSSKKGLLGLLGLLGLIPLLLCLLLCCLLLPCLLRRKKTEGDVHIATLDPYAGPVAGSVAPGTACYAPSMGMPVY